MSLYNHPRYLAFAQAIHDAPGDTTTQLILADWLRDHDAGEWAAQETLLVRRLSQWDVWSFEIEIGSGIGSKGYKVQHMRIGKSYLVHCGDWHTFVGRVVDQIGPQTYEMECVSKIAETDNGDCWHELAAGKKGLREAASYKHFKGRCPVPLAIFATEWEGQLPQEAGYPG